MARPMTEAISLRYEFTEHERADLGAELAQVYQERAKLDEDRKSQAAQLKEREAGLENRIGTLGRSRLDMRCGRTNARSDGTIRTLGNVPITGKITDRLSNRVP